MNKKCKSNKNYHTSNDKFLSQESFGSGIKNPEGRVIRSYIFETSSDSYDNRFGKPPKSLA